MDGDTWDWYDTDLSSQCKTQDGCYYDIDDDEFMDCSVEDRCLLNKYNEEVGGELVGERMYAYTSGGGWEPSIYTRRLVVGPTVNGGAQVTVTVSWDSTLFRGEKSVALTTYVYDHYTRFE